jgi:transcriptional regulator with XRE-family HTH domain
MKSFSAYLKKLPAERRARIEESARQKISAIRLQQAREALGITQGELAERMHMTQPALSRFERRPNITMAILQRYVEALGGTLEVNVVLPKQGPKGPGKRPTTSKQRIALISA